MIVVNARFLTQQLSGVQRYAIELSLKLKEQLKEEVIFLTPSNILIHEVAKQLKATIIGKHTGYLWEQWDLPQWLRKHDSPLLVNFANLAPIKYRNKITVIHDVMFLNYGDDNAKFRTQLYKALIPLVIKTSKHIITVSQYSKREIGTHYNLSANDITIIPPACSKKLSPKRDLNLQQKYFFSLGSCSRSKNLRLTLEAFVLFAQKHKDIMLYVGGYDSSVEQFERKGLGEYARHQNIKLLGRISDDELSLYYSNAIAFLFPSLSEGFGIPPLEAQTCGCPVITSNVTSLPEIYGESGLLCNPHSTEDLVEKMEMLLDENTRLELTRKGFANVMRFSWDISAGRLIECINNYQ